MLARMDIKTDVNLREIKEETEASNEEMKEEMKATVSAILHEMKSWREEKRPIRRSRRQI
jgi:hypothetical protein